MPTKASKPKITKITRKLKNTHLSQSQTVSTIVNKKPITRVTRKVKSTLKHQVQSQNVSTIVNVNIDNTKNNKKKRSPPRVVPPVILNPAPPANRMNNDYTPNRPYIAEKISIASPYNNGLIPEENLNVVDKTHRARTVESIEKEASVSGSLVDGSEGEFITTLPEIKQKMNEKNERQKMEALHKKMSKRLITPITTRVPMKTRASSKKPKDDDSQPSTSKDKPPFR